MSGSLEQRFAIERARVAGNGDFKGLREFGVGFVVFWTRISEWWGPADYWKS